MATAKPQTTNTVPNVDAQQLQAALAQALGSGFLQAQGLVMTPPEDRSWKGEDGSLMHIRSVDIACGTKVVTHRQMGDNPNDFQNVQIGQIVRVDIDNAKSEKGKMQIQGRITPMN